MRLKRPDSLQIKLVALLFIPIILYWQDFIQLGKEATQSDLSTHIIIIPFLIAYMIYRLRKVISATISYSKTAEISLDTLLGLLLFLLAIIVKWFGSYSFYPLEYHIASLPIMVTGLTLIIFNRETLKKIFFPIFFLLFLIPPPITFAQQIGSILAVVSANLSFNILKVLGFPVIMNNELDVPIIYMERSTGEVIPFAIDIACSGLYSFIGLIVFAFFFAYISSGSLRKKVTVLVATFPLIYITNVVRITLIILVGYYTGIGTSLNLIHLLSGWVLILLGTFTMLTLAERLFNINIFEIESQPCTHLNLLDGICLECGALIKTPTKLRMPQSEVIKLAALLLGSVLLLSLQIPVFPLSHGQAGVIEDQNNEVKLMQVLPEIEGYNLEFIYRDTDFERISRQNASMWYRYQPLDPSNQTIWVGLEIAITRSLLHNWEICLVVMPARAERYSNIKVDLRDIHLLDNPPLSARYFAYHPIDSNVTEVILYWYTEAIFETSNGLENLLTKISLVQYVTHPDLYKGAENRLHPIGVAVANYWRPISTWSGIGISIARNSSILIILSLLAIGSILLFERYRYGKRRDRATKTYQALKNPEDIVMIKVLAGLPDRHVGEFEIMKAYTEVSGDSIDAVELRYKLEKAEKIGVVQSTIVNKNNIPCLSWSLIAHV